jgi:hypothetical protein
MSESPKVNVQTLMTFPQTVTALQAGKKVRRVSWPEGTIWELHATLEQFHEGVWGTVAPNRADFDASDWVVVE